MLGITAKSSEQYLTEVRQALHRIPEMADCEYATRDYIMAQLQLTCPDELSILNNTGIKAVYRSGRGRTIAFRADMDALPITECNDSRAYRSLNEGMMHACGHDGHMAILLGLARAVAERRGEMSADCVLLFQPAEEGRGGALKIINEGALTYPDVNEIYGFHIWPSVEGGCIGLRSGPLMAQTVEFDITVNGLAAHGAEPHKGIDAIAAAAELISSLQGIISRRTNPLDSALITIGRVNGGSARNVIADRVVLEGIMRAFSNAECSRMTDLIKAKLAALELAHNVTCQWSQTGMYPAVDNDPALCKALQDKMPDGRFIQAQPVMMAEDFSDYQARVPGVFMFLGSGRPQLQLHTPQFDFDHSALMLGLDTFLRILSLE